MAAAVSDLPARHYRFGEGAAPDGWPAVCVDADDYDRARAAADAFRATLARIADAESGVWGWWAHDALRAHPEGR